MKFKFKINDKVVFNIESYHLYNPIFTHNKDYIILTSDIDSYGNKLYIIHNNANQPIRIYEDHFRLSPRQIRSDIIDKILN